MVEAPKNGYYLCPYEEISRLNEVIFKMMNEKEDAYKCDGCNKYFCTCDLETTEDGAELCDDCYPRVFS